MSYSKGFTLIELLVAIFIFAVISVTSYNIVTSIITTKTRITSFNHRWGSIARLFNILGVYVNRTLPLSARGINGGILPAFIVKKYTFFY